MKKRIVALMSTAVFALSMTACGSAQEQAVSGDAQAASEDGADTVSTIAELQPDAQVSEDGLSIPRNDVADAESEITSWAEELGL